MSIFLKPKKQFKFNVRIYAFESHLICFRYPDYEFFGDEKIAESAKLGKRYSKDSLTGLLTDIYTLSKCDFVTCTMSSQV